MTSALRLSVVYRLDRRRADGGTGSPGGAAWLHQVDGRLAYRPTALVAVGLASTYLRMDLASDSTGGVFSTLRAGPDAEIQWGWLEARLALWGGRLDDPAAGVRDAQVGISTGLLARIMGNLDGFAGFDWAASVTSSGLATDRYARHVFLVGLVGHVTGKFTPAASAVDLRPRWQGGRVRLRVRVEQAGEVRVIGSWDGWGSSTPLHGVQPPGVWEAWLELPRGTHRYRFLADGRAVPPPEGVATLPDDFGDKDAVVDVVDVSEGAP
jgi:hypothetical protein